MKPSIARQSLTASLVSACGAFWTLITPVTAQQPGPTLASAISQLRTALCTFDYEGGLRVSDSLVLLFPKSSELGALRIVLMW